MTRRIVNIVIFAIAAIACVLAIIYAAMFDSDKINQYKAVGVLHDNNPELLSELSATTPETLPAYVEKCQTVASELDGELRSEKKAKEGKGKLLRLSVHPQGSECRQLRRFQSRLSCQCQGFTRPVRHRRQIR